MRTLPAVRPLRWLVVLGLVALASVRAADVESLVRVLRDPDKTAEAKGEACLQLMDLGQAAAPAVPALVSLLGNQEEMLRDYAVSTLDRIGPAARNALPALRRTAVKDSSPEIRELARGAIAKIGAHVPGTESVTVPETAAETEPARAPTQTRPEPAIARAEAPVARTDAPTVQPAAPAPATETPSAEPESSRSKLAETTRRAASVTARPTLELHPGRFFRWAVPIGWTGSESANGVTLTAADGLMQVSSALILGQPGKMNPAEFTLLMLDKLQYKSLQTLAKRDLPDQPSGLEGVWRIQELEMRYTVNGAPVHAIWTTGILPLEGKFDAYLLGYQSIPLAFERAKLWLASIAHSVAPTSPVAGSGSPGSEKLLSGFGNVNYIIKVQGEGNDKLILPTNRPLDHPALLEIWRGQGLSEDRILRAQRNGMMGYEVVRDSQNGRIFEMPLEIWDSAAGGYHNPLRPDETLQAVESGE